MQEPVSYQPLASPHNRIAQPEVWSNRLLATNVAFGVLNNAPLALLFRIVLPVKITDGVQVRFSIPISKLAGSISFPRSFSNTILNSFIGSFSSERTGLIVKILFF